MKSRSFQQSLLQQILGLDQASYPSFSRTNIPDQPYLRSSLTGSNAQQRSQKNRIRYNKSDVCPSDIQLNINFSVKQEQQNRSTKCQFLQLEDEILKMQIKAKNESKAKLNNEQHAKNRCKNLKTQNFQQQMGNQINYSTIYTRRSSLDQSLYDKAIREQSAKKQWVTKRQKQKQQNQLKQCSYKPEINKTSKQIMAKINKQQLYHKIQKKKHQSIKRIIQQSQMRQLKQCSFTPNIETTQRKANKSVKIQKFTLQQPQNTACQHQRKSVSIFDHLYQDSKSRQQKSKKLQQNYVKQCSKQPTIDQISRQITKDTNFETRMIQYEKKKLQKHIRLVQKQNKQMRESYRPSINSTSHNRHIQTPIGQYLYLQSKRQTKRNTDQSIGHKKNKNEKNSALAPCNLPVNKKSTKFYQQRKTLVFYQLFQMLDADQDGKISINAINLDCLPHQIIKIIYPLIDQLQVMQVDLAQQQFVASIQKLFKTLTVYQRDLLLGLVGSSQKPQDPILQFQPKLNRRSKMIAQCNQRSQMNIYEYCSIKSIQKQRYLEQERLEKEKKQLEVCTFQPRIIGRRGC